MFAYYASQIGFPPFLPNFLKRAYPIVVVTEDFNGDGKPDLAIVNAGSNSVSVLLGNGLGGLCSATYFPVGEWPQSVVIGDFNGDSKPDL